MKREDDDKDRSCSSPSNLDLIPLDLKMATVPTKSHMKKSHQNKLEEDEKDTTNPSKLGLDSLPLDLKMAILTRMPAKCLMKLRCVSKMWSSIIRSRGFIDSYYAMSSRQSRFVVGFSNGAFGKPEEKLTFFFSFSHDEGQESSSLLPTFEMAMPSFLFSSFGGYCTSFHGILTLKGDGRTVMCNPNTEQFTRLPANTSYVGYDPIGDQYKALCFDFDCRHPRIPTGHKVLTLGGGEGMRQIKGAPVPYRPILPNVCINGVLYYGARTLSETKDPVDPVIVCFDVRSEKLSFIKAPAVVVRWAHDSILIEYKGKLASIVRQPFGGHIRSFDFYILEDPKKHEWSRQTCVFPFSVWDYVGNVQISFFGTNKAGEIIIAPMILSHDVRPFYIFYYNVETKTMRRVRLLGIGDDKEFRRSYGFENNFGNCIICFLLATHAYMSVLHIHTNQLISS
ncbi:F-box associated interaction domain [Arabidopsis thaliana x Arabidopsis arenosa]|uniref:F-box associated interaction domain n=1 Tax=Arabidopsis thaliana x Arabidopsis arenosa TaxID=1240361 RepID=A0A8T2C7A0_9BRAS|nr:F-box associated interaction domain [Arabidopsis thaliana x Arabidopsis arenosa]